MPFPAALLSRRTLPFIYLCDCSGSMAAQGKMRALNQAIRQSLPLMVSVAEANPEVQLLVQAIAFGDVARWHIAEPTPIEQLSWRDLHASGMTAMGAAFELLLETLSRDDRPRQMLPPVVVLISDGQPTDNYAEALTRLMEDRLAQRCVRLAIAIGQDTDLEVLQQFIGSGPKASKPLQASNATALAHYIEWASSAVVGSSSSLTPHTPPAPLPIVSNEDPSLIW